MRGRSPQAEQGDVDVDVAGDVASFVPDATRSAARSSSTSTSATSSRSTGLPHELGEHVTSGGDDLGDTRLELDVDGH